MHLLHDVHPTAGTADDLRLINVVIEISKHSQVKYELDKIHGYVKVDRVLAPGFSYPQNYGFIPRTHAGDDDPLDVFVIGVPLLPGTVACAKIIGIIKMHDKGEVDHKILAVHADDDSINDLVLSDLSDQVEQIKAFLQEYKGRVVSLLGVEDEISALMSLEEDLTEYESRKFELYPTHWGRVKGV